MTNIKHIFFGDSLTSCDSLPVEKKWINLLEKSVQQEFGDQIQYETINRGFCGENTRQALERMQKDVQFAEPDILTIQFGANDSDYWLSNKGAPCVTLAAFEANIVEMIDRAIIFQVKKIILHTSHHFLQDRVEINRKTHSQNQVSYNEVIRKVTKRLGLPLVDIEKELGRHQPAEYCLQMPDGVHQNEFGSELYFASAEPIVKECVRSILNGENNV